MKRIILITIFIIFLFILTGCETAVEEGQTQQEIQTAPTTKEPTGTLSADQVDTIPDISIRDCLTQVKQTNPEMSNQAANDNCYAIEAVNKGDKSLCNKVSTGFRANCLAQFEEVILTQQKPSAVVQEPTGTLSADQVDTIPDISISECLAQIKATNPEMSDQDASDNCYTIEAINKGDSSLCDKVSASFRASCLAQF
jgi:hypothetical protein